jgi:hypothetical protein
MEKSVPKSWFLAEWISIIATFVVCFVFLFQQNQTQSARSDNLYQQWVENQKEIQKNRIESDQRWADLKEKSDERWADLLQKFYEGK